MKHWKQGFIGVLVVISLAFAFTACGEKEETHTHTYSTTWSKDATQHWHECTANDGAKTDVANHTGNPCTICGYETPAVPAPKTITQETPNGLAFTGKVTIFLYRVNDIKKNARPLPGKTGQWSGAFPRHALLLQKLKNSLSFLVCLC